MPDPIPLRVGPNGGTCHGQSTEARFWAKVDVRGAGDCWEWTGSRTSFGHGRLSIRAGKLDGAHRIAWTIHHGPIPAGHVVRHDCDNPPCVNPAHLRLGTAADNRADMYRRGRARGGSVSRPGELNPVAKLTTDQVAEIRAMAGSCTQRALAARFDISPAQVSRILNGKRWAAP